MIVSSRKMCIFAKNKFMNEVLDDIFNSEDVLLECSDIQNTCETPTDWYRMLYERKFPLMLALHFSCDDNRIENVRFAHHKIMYILSAFCDHISDVQVVNTSLEYKAKKDKYYITYEIPNHVGYYVKEEPYDGLLIQCNKDDLIFKYGINFTGSLDCFLQMCCAFNMMKMKHFDAPSLQIIGRWQYPDDMSMERAHPYAGILITRFRRNQTISDYTNIPILTAARRADKDYYRYIYKTQKVPLFKLSETCQQQIQQTAFVIWYQDVFPKVPQDVIYRKVAHWFDRNLPTDIPYRENSKIKYYAEESKLRQEQVHYQAGGSGHH